MLIILPTRYSYAVHRHYYSKCRSPNRAHREEGLSSCGQGRWERGKTRHSQTVESNIWVMAF